MKTIAKKASELTIGKRYFLDGLMDVSCVLTHVTGDKIIFNDRQGNGGYIEHPDGSIRFNKCYLGGEVFYEIVDE